ncbi:hypothetical protein J3U68_07005 [Snodgrassella sp. B3882]|uniref:hypothetical protein n=1 Tax=Snodgrassella sp. B3882 TaxID=2818037 RepID=UPI002269AB4E|nr:hypothetical protein [Snodgrassella sp. B3882]MCX8745153.1 hypothetical protein [Snodgrassella sp. B3882]
MSKNFSRYNQLCRQFDLAAQFPQNLWLKTYKAINFTELQRGLANARQEICIHTDKPFSANKGA